MKWIKRIAIFLGILVAVLAAVPFFITLDDYLPRIEKLAAERIGEPVKIQHLRFSVLPMPHVKLDGISIGKTDDLKVGKIRITPDLWSLAQPVKVIQSVEITGLVLTQKGIDKIPAWTKSEAKPDAPVQPAALRVKTIRLEDATLKLEKVTLGPLDARVSLNDAGEPRHASLATRDGKLKAFIKPDRSNYLVDIAAKSWQLPVGPPMLFDELTVKGVATKTQARLGNVQARLYGGTVTGKVDIGWQKGLSLKGEAIVDQIQLRDLVPLFSPKTRMSGRLIANPVAFSANAPKAAQLQDYLRLQTPFQVREGVIYGVDIQKAATSFTKEQAAGGETRFQELSGNLAVEGRARKFTSLKIASGSFGANGHVTISPAQELSGRINAEVKAAKVTAASVPLNVSGTVQSPLLFPTAAYLAGAAAGTAVLGPGIGTTVGAKIGGWAESLFGSDEKEKAAGK